MLVLLRSARFRYPDGSASILVELRRHHDTDARCRNKEFLVTTRLSRFDPKVLIRQSFGTYREAVRAWEERVARLEDQGLRRHDATIIGFHEEG